MAAFSPRCVRTASVLLAAGVLVAAPRQATGFDALGRLGPVTYRVLSPDWISQGETLSVLIACEGPPSGVGSTPVVAALTVDPRGFEVPPADSSAGLREVTVRAGETLRLAFTGIRARRDVPTGSYRFALRLETLGGADPPGERIAFSVRTVRGAVVPRGPWSIFVPALISLLSIPLFVLFLRRYGEPEAWRRPHEPRMPEGEATWWMDS